MSNDTVERIETADQMPGLLEPFQNTFFTGQSKAEDIFLKSAQGGRLHHAWLLTGGQGSGKATFAFRVARAMLSRAFAQPEALSREMLDACADLASPSSAQIAGGAHTNLLHLRRPFDNQTKKFKTQITIDEIRRCTRFFGTTPGDGAWRIAIIDQAEEMNKSAANALLKILEEPPERTLFFLICSKPGQMLPTLKSRCLTLSFSRLAASDIAAILGRVSEDTVSSDTDLTMINTIAGGDVKRVFECLNDNVDGVLTSLNKAIKLQNYNDLERIADVISSKQSENLYALFVDYTQNHLHSRARTASHGSLLARTLEVWDKANMRFANEAALNIDRKQTVMSVLRHLSLLETSNDHE